jgi:hypothetical protein
VYAWERTQNRFYRSPAIDRAHHRRADRRRRAGVFENPGKAQQAFEVGAFGLDSNKDGNEFVLDVVMTGN